MEGRVQVHEITPTAYLDKVHTRSPQLLLAYKTKEKLNTCYLFAMPSVCSMTDWVTLCFGVLCTL